MLRVHNFILVLHSKEYVTVQICGILIYQIIPCKHLFQFHSTNFNNALAFLCCLDIEPTTAGTISGDRSTHIQVLSLMVSWDEYNYIMSKLE